MRDLFENFPSDRAVIIKTFVGGSSLHGVKLDGTDDLDIYGVFVEHAHVALGLDGFEHYVTSTAPQGTRNGTDDVDVTLYSFRKFCALAASDNPTIIHFLYEMLVTYHSPLTTVFMTMGRSSRHGPELPDPF